MHWFHGQQTTNPYTTHVTTYAFWFTDLLAEIDDHVTSNCLNVQFWSTFNLFESTYTFSVGYSKSWKVDLNFEFEQFEVT